MPKKGRGAGREGERESERESEREREGKRETDRHTDRQTETEGVCPVSPSASTIDGLQAHFAQTSSRSAKLILCSCICFFWQICLLLG